MPYHDVDEIQELFSVKDVNDALKEGWRIVAVVPGVQPGTVDMALDMETTCYVLGRKVAP